MLVLYNDDYLGYDFMVWARSPAGQNYYLCLDVHGPISFFFFGFLVTIDIFCLESGLLSYFCPLKLVKKNKEKDIDLLSTVLS